MDTLANLTQLDRVPLDMTLEGLGAVNRGVQADNIGLQELMRKQSHEQQMDPLRIEQQQLMNRGRGIQNDMSLEGLATARRDNRKADFLFDDNLKAEHQAILGKLGDEKLKAHHRQVQKLAMSQNPRERQIGEALMGQTEAALKERRAHQYKLEELKQTGANTLAVARENSAGKLAVKGAGGAGAPKQPKSPRELYTQYAILAQQASTPEEAAQYTQLANDQWSKVIEEGVAKAGAAAANKPDMSKLGIDTNPPVQPQPLPNPQRAKQQQQAHSLADVKKMYPGKSDAELKAAYKQKFGIDLQ